MYIYTLQLGSESVEEDVGLLGDYTGIIANIIDLVIVGLDPVRGDSFSTIIADHSRIMAKP